MIRVFIGRFGKQPYIFNVRKDMWLVINYVAKLVWVHARSIVNCNLYNYK